MAYTPSQLRKQVLPGFTFALNALNKANQDDYRKRDLRDLYAILQRLPEADSRLMGMMKTYRDALLGWDWQIGDTENDKEAQDLTAKFIESGLHENLDLLINSAFTGIVLIGPVRDPEGNYNFDYFDLTDIAPWPAAPTGVALMHMDGGILRAEPVINTANYIRDLYNPLKGIRKNYVGGLLRSVLFPVLIKHITIQLRTQWSERYTDPTRSVTWQQGASLDDIKAAKDWAENPGGNESLAASEKVKASFLESINNPSREAFQATIDDCNKEMEILILGQTATTEGTPGSLGNEEARENVRHDIMWAELKRIERIVNTQFLNVEYGIMRGENAVLPRSLHFRWLTDESEDRQKNAITFQTLHEMGVDLDLDHVLQKTGGKSPADQERTLKGKEPNQMPRF